MAPASAAAVAAPVKKVAAPRPVPPLPPRKPGVITFAFSPDADDAFMFYGLAKGGVATGDLEVAHVLADIETLNRHAQEGRHEVTAISFHAYPHVADKYALMPCGGSIGDGYGPLLVAREAFDPKWI